MALRALIVATQAEDLPKRFGPFVLLRELGVGGMGAAYLALHAETDALLVVKRMHPELLREETIFKRFVHEAEVAAHVQHPNVAALVAMGKIEDEPFLATEYVFGIQVSQVVERIESGVVDPIPLDVGLALAVDLASGVEAIHGARHRETGQPLALVHRDIGSRNVLLGFDGIIRIIDLGLGKSVLSDWQTASEVLAGSPDYMAPEQAMGGRVDARADVYAAAVTAWELLAGRKRIREDGVAARLAKAIQAQPEPLVVHRADASKKLEAVLKQAMNADPEQRTPTAQLFRKALADELSSVGKHASNVDVSRWLDSACATVIAREKRALAEARARGRALTAPDVAKTVVLVGRPETYLARRSAYEVYEEPDPVIARESTSGSITQPSARGLKEDQPRPAARGSEASNGSSRWFLGPPRPPAPGAEAERASVAQTLPPERPAKGALLALLDPAHFRAQPKAVRIMLIAGAGAALIGIAVLTALIVSPRQPDIEVTGIPETRVLRAADVPTRDRAPPKPAHREPPESVTEEPTAIPPDAPDAPDSDNPAAEPEAREAAGEPGTSEHGSKVPSSPIADEGGHLGPEAAMRKADLVRRIRQLRRVRFDVGFQKRVTQLSTKLSRARTMRALDEIEAALVRLERET